MNRNADRALANSLESSNYNLGMMTAWITARNIGGERLEGIGVSPDIEVEDHCSQAGKDEQMRRRPRN
jgi:C-terminal processing protease CtpA/Prc